MRNRPDWWLYVKKIIGDYPRLKRQAVLTDNERRRTDAIESTIAQTSTLPDGQHILKIIKLVYWDKSHTIEGAALQVPCAANTAGAWQARFLRMLADKLNLT